MRRAMGAHRRQGGIEAARAQHSDFVERASVDHLIVTPIDARVEL